MTVLRSAVFNLFLFTSKFLLCVPATVLSFVAPGRMLAFVQFWARVEMAAA